MFNFLKTAQDIVEAQYHSATAGAHRANQSTLQRWRRQLGADITFGGTKHPSSGSTTAKRRKRKRRKLQEQVTDPTAPTPQNPNVTYAQVPNQSIENAPRNILAQKFAAAMAELGHRLGIGQLQDRLRQMGIDWYMTDDGLGIIFYVQSTDGKQQPIYRINIESLAEKNKFQEYLLGVLDMAKGEPPGSTKQRQDQLRKQEQLTREVADMAMQQPITIGPQWQPPMSVNPSVAVNLAAKSTPTETGTEAPENIFNAPGQQNQTTK